MYMYIHVCGRCTGGGGLWIQYRRVDPWRSDVGAGGNESPLAQWSRVSGVSFPCTRITGGTAPVPSPGHKATTYR